VHGGRRTLHYWHLANLANGVVPRSHDHEEFVKQLRIDGSIETHRNRIIFLRESFMYVQFHVAHQLPSLPMILNVVFKQKYETMPITALPKHNALRFLLSTPDSFKPDTYSPIDVVVSKFGIYLKSKFVSSPSP